MAARKWTDVGVVMGGVLMLAAALAHTFLGAPALAAELTAAGVPPQLLTGVLIGWTFGGTAMAVLGILVLLDWRRLRRGEPDAGTTAMVIGAFWLLFGAGASLVRFPSPHFLPFVAVGLLVCAALLVRRRTQPRP